MKLFNHQKQAVKSLLKNKGIGAIYHEIGMGKTLTALETFSRLRKSNEELTLYVICPLSLIEGAWGEDIKKFTKYNYRNLHEKRIKKQKKPPFDIYIVNYEWLLHNNLLEYVGSKQNSMIVIDESSKMKNNKAAITKILLSINHYFNYRVLMSGTPAPNIETEYWAQMTFLNYGIFHYKFNAFKNEYFHLSRGNQVMRGQFMTRATAREIFSHGWEYAITDEKRKELMLKIQPYCHYADKEKCLDLPDRINEIRDIYMQKKQASIYNQMKKNCIAEIEGENIIAQVALTKIMKLRQITSGFAFDDHGIARAVEGGSPKVEELKNIIEQVGNKQLIIWCQFHWEIEALQQIIGNCSVLYGKVPANKRQNEIDDFRSGKNRFLIAHPASAGHGLTFVNCNIQIFFSLNYSWEQYEQARGRIHRPGQKNNCLYIHLICEDTIDKIIYDVLQRKGDSQELIRRFLA